MNIILDAVCEKLWNGIFVGYITAIFTDHQNGSYDYLDFYISSMKYYEMSNIIIIYEVMIPGIKMQNIWYPFCAKKMLLKERKLFVVNSF